MKATGHERAAPNRDVLRARSALARALARPPLRRRHHSYVSLESALSEYGAISQVPLSVVTVMTTGRGGRVRTAWETIEFTHTARPRSTLLEGIVEIGRPLRFARPRTALADLRRVGRNLHLVDLEELEDAA